MRYGWIILGAEGRMGRRVRTAAAAAGDRVVAALDRGMPWPAPDTRADAVIDFSSADAAAHHAAFAAERGLPLVLGTTGLDADAERAIRAAAERIPVFRSANMSVGAALLARLLRMAAPYLEGYQAEIVETHHTEKKDRPSGTALLLAEALGAEIPTQIHALRLGRVVGDHTVYLANDREQLELTHRARDRSVFADGALRAARFLVGQPPGLYTMDDLIADGPLGDL